MEVTEAFKEAVESKNLLTIRILLKDSLIYDKHFNRFNDMKKYLDNKNINIWMSDTDPFVEKPEYEWNKNLMNLELTKLVYNFTEDRVKYCQKIIQKLYFNEIQNEKYKKINKAVIDKNVYIAIKSNIQKLSDIIYKKEYSEITNENILDIFNISIDIVLTLSKIKVIKLSQTILNKIKKYVNKI